MWASSASWGDGAHSDPKDDVFTQLSMAPGIAYGLRVDGRRGPALAVDSTQPRLEWRMPADVGDAESLVVEAAHSEEALGDRTAVIFTVRLPLGAVAVHLKAPLTPRDIVCWRVGLDHGPEGIRWSETARFEVALLDADWEARWITSADWAHPEEGYSGAPAVLGRDFEAPSPVIRARLHLAASGTVEPRLNGAAIDDEVLGFGYTVESSRLPARAFDVTDLIIPGSNMLRITIAGGISWVPPVTDRYTKLTTAALPPRLLARLEVTCENGQEIVVVSDDAWSTGFGPVRGSHWYGGEDADGRIAEPDTPIDDGWMPCAVLDVSHPIWWLRRPPLRVVDRIRGGVHSSGPNSTIIDFGTNVVGWPVLTLSGCAGDETIRVRPAEILLDDELDQRTTGSPIWDAYVTRPGDQLWHPRHVYHGFRYIEVSGIPSSAFVAEAAVIRTDNELVGSFETSDTFLQTLHTIIDRAVQGNMYSVFTDCPNREKLGWIEQLHLCFGLLARMYDVEAHLADTLVLMRDAQRASGLVPSTVPETTDFSGIDFGGDPTAFVDDVNWGGAIAHLALLHHREYGDRRILEDTWPSIERYLDHIRARATEGLLDFGLGDWVALDDSTPRAMAATHGWIALLRVAAEISAVLGNQEQRLELLREGEVSAFAFARAFGTVDGSQWGSGSQASLALALDLDVVPAEHRSAVVERLVESIEASGGRLTVGENSWPALVRVLHLHGHDAVVDRMVRNDDGPGYGLQIALGATALAETWRGASGAMYENSQNHFMLGMIHDWIAGDIGGLAQAAPSIAWEHAVVAPNPLGADRVRISQETTRGRFDLEWDAVRRSLDVTVPVGAGCTVIVPAGWSDVAQGAHRLSAGHWTWAG